MKLFSVVFEGAKGGYLSTQFGRHHSDFITTAALWVSLGEEKDQEKTDIKFKLNLQFGHLLNSVVFLASPTIKSPSNRYALQLFWLKRLAPEGVATSRMLCRTQSTHHKHPVATTTEPRVYPGAPVLQPLAPD